MNCLVVRALVSKMNLELFGCLYINVNLITIRFKTVFTIFISIEFLISHLDRIKIVQDMKLYVYLLVIPHYIYAVFNVVLYKKKKIYKLN